MPIDISDPKNLEGYVLRFTTDLPFPEEDKELYPWLANRDRYYVIDKLLDKGGFSLAFRGFPCSSQGHPISNAGPVVIKIPNLAPGYTTLATDRRRNYIAKQSIIEWQLIRRKLFDCKYANPIFDLGSILVSGPTLIELYVTVQPLLSDATPFRQ
jgi:hypothetical protein